jgi:hypothetical protein
MWCTGPGQYRCKWAGKESSTSQQGTSLDGNSFQGQLVMCKGMRWYIGQAATRSIGKGSANR